MTGKFGDWNYIIEQFPMRRTWQLRENNVHVYSIFFIDGVCHPRQNAYVLPVITAERKQTKIRNGKNQNRKRSLMNLEAVGN